MDEHYMITCRFSEVHRANSHERAFQFFYDPNQSPNEKEVLPIFKDFSLDGKITWILTQKRYTLQGLRRGRELSPVEEGQ
jgi:hypothetical protein